MADQNIGVQLKAHIVVELGNAEHNPAKIYGKMTAGKSMSSTIIFQKKTPFEAVEVHIGEDFKLEKNEIVVHDHFLAVTAKLYDQELCPPHLMLEGIATFEAKPGIMPETKSISGKHGSINITVTFYPAPVPPVN